MDFFVRFLSERPYKIAAPDELTTPCFLLFRDRFEDNIRRMRALLDSIVSGFSFRSLWPHAKTHKSLWVTRQLMKEGILSFKTSPNEVDMLAEAGVEAMFIAFPLVKEEAFRVARLAKKHRQTRFIVQASRSEHIEYLLNAAKKYDIHWEYFIDLDVGMNRTGIPPEKALEFFRSIGHSDYFKFIGFHAYDGHNTSFDREERRKTSKASIDPLVDVFKKFEKESIRVPMLMMGGTPSFITDLEYLNRIHLDTEIILSPGTWVYFDTMDHDILPDTFDVAALILAQVMDRPGTDTAALNLGYKRWAIDQGPVEGFSIEGMKALSWSEEHTVVSVPDGATVDIGDYVLIAPRHVCSTVNLWEHVIIIGPDGAVELRDCPIDARNR